MAEDYVKEDLLFYLEVLARDLRSGKVEFVGDVNAKQWRNPDEVQRFGADTPWSVKLEFTLRNTKKPSISKDVYYPYNLERGTP